MAAFQFVPVVKNTMSDSSFTKEFFKLVESELLPRIVKATVPFYAVQNDKVVRDRSGVLLQIADEHFILTASHNLRQIVEADIYLYVGWDEEDRVPVPIPDAIFHMTEDDCRDVAAIKLSHETAEQILSQKEPIALRDVTIQEDRSPGLFLVCGFPQAWTTVFEEDIESIPLPFLGKWYSGQPSPKAQIQYDPDIHALFEFHREAIRSNDLQKEELPPFKGIQGISGCGIWRVVDWKQDNPSILRTDQLRLVAIQHRYYEDYNYIHSTWVKFAVQQIYDNYPDMRNAIRLVYPL